MGNDLVGATGDVEAVDEVAAHHRGKIRADLLKVEANRCGFVAIDHDLGLRLIDLGIDEWRESEFAALHRGRLQLFGESQHLLGLGGGEDDELNRELSAARQSRWHYREHLDAGNRSQLFLHLGQDLKRSLLALAPRFNDHAAEAARWKGELESEIRFREAEKILFRRVGKGRGLIDGRVGRCIDDAEDNALIFGRCQLAIHRDGKFEEEKREKRQADPGNVDRRAHLQRAIEHSPVRLADAIESLVDLAREAVLFGAGP